MKKKTNKATNMQNPQLKGGDWKPKCAKTSVHQNWENNSYKNLLQPAREITFQVENGYSYFSSMYLILISCFKRNARPTLITDYGP